MDALPNRYLPRKEKDTKGVEHDAAPLEPVPEHLEHLIPPDLKGKLKVDRPAAADKAAPAKTTKKET